jgi:sterol desaturase/sphingolipid hydroxylase (fatty acid hydroxylase superfamily)
MNEVIKSDAIKPKSSGTRALFQSPVLEKLSRTHISVPLIIMLSYSFILLYWSITHTALSTGLTAGLFFCGLFFYTWLEYMLHRHIFHMATYTTIRKKLQYVMHGVHHEFPKDKSRLAMPPLLSITLSSVLLLIFRVILGDFVFAFLPGVLVGYSTYLSIHYMIHVFQPPNNFFKRLWINHSVHHYKNGEVVFGVSSPLWDYVYRTR